VNSLTKQRLALAISAVIGNTAYNAAYAQDPAVEEPSDEITVTGSRIVRRDFTAPSPIVTVENENFFNTSSTGVENVLNDLPQYVPAGTQFSAFDIQPGATNSSGAATLNLRGMGTNRNLVIIDGRRAQPVNASLVVDVNTIPAAAIQSVEIITGGASAVYGPDALAGVTNFKLRDDFEGVEIGLRGSSAAEGDGEETNFNVLLGMNAADGRGNVMVGVDWTDRNPIYQRDRDFYINAWLDPNNPSGQFMQPRSFGASEGLNLPGGFNPPSQAATDAVFAQYGVPAGTVGRTSEFRFNNDGTVFVTQQGINYRGPLNCLDPAQCGAFTGIKRLTNGNLDQMSTVGLLQAPMERFSTFLKGHYDIGDSLSAFAQANYANIEVLTNGGIPPAITVWQSPVPRDGRALPADLNALLDSRCVAAVGAPAGDCSVTTFPDGSPRSAGPWSLYQVLNYNGPIQQENTSDVWQIMVGLEGEIGASVTWEAYISKGQTDIENANFRMPSLQRYQFMIQQPNFGLGGPFFYNPATSMIGSGRGYALRCTTGLPVFSDFTPSQDCIDGIDTQQIAKSELTQDIAEFNLSGSFANLPGGEIGYAAGTSYRKNEYQFSPGNPFTMLTDNPIGLFASAPTGGKTDVKEIYGEMLLPLVDRFELELGYRYSDFNTAGGHDTYKALFTLDATDRVSFRGGRQVATRAPNTAELFTAPTQIVVGHPDGDPCSVTTRSPWGNVATPGSGSPAPNNPNRAQVQALCRALIGNANSGFDTQTYSITGVPGPDGWHRQNPAFFPLEIELRQGNPKVGPETGETYTFGVVVNGLLGADNLTVAADYYEINMKDAISPLPAYIVYNDCFNWNGSTNPTYDVNHPSCRMIRRNASSGDREEVDAPFSNLGIIETNGIDLTVNWRGDFGPGSFGVNSVMSFLDEFIYQAAPGGRVIDATGTLDTAGQPGSGGFYELQAMTNFSYTWDSFALGLGWRYLDAIKSAAAASSPNTTQQGTSAYNMFNLYGSYDWSRYTVRFGIDNLLDEDPRIIGANPAAGDTNSDLTLPALYDIVGTRYYLGFTARF
jgi:outer membrane receptor protein involved in Fe transport